MSVVRPSRNTLPQNEKSHRESQFLSRKRALESLDDASRTRIVELQNVMGKNPTNLFPMFLKLAGRRCLVVGAGTIAESKIESLVQAGARIKVVAPEATDKIQRWSRARQIVWRKRAYRPTDLGGAFLVIAATSSAKLHRGIFRLARRSGILCNA